MFLNKKIGEVEGRPIGELMGLGKGRKEEWMRKHTEVLKERMKTDDAMTGTAMMISTCLANKHSEVAEDLSQKKYSSAIMDVCLMHLHMGYLMGIQQMEDKEV